MNISAVILAAGTGTRMRSKKTKVLHEICGRSMINWVTGSCFEAGIEKIAVVISPAGNDIVKEAGSRHQFFIQNEQLGTGHALMQAVEFIRGSGNTAVLCGDVPLLSPGTIKALMEDHETNGFDATVLTSIAADPKGYGRIIRKEDGLVEKIVEQTDADLSQENIAEVNSGIYIFRSVLLLETLDKITDRNKQGEYYLTDIIEIISREGGKTGAYITADPQEVTGINDRVQLAAANRIARARILKEHMRNGVTIEDPDSTYIDAGITIESDTCILPGTMLKGKTKIGADCVIGPNSRISDSVIGDWTSVDSSVVTGSMIGRNTAIGPFAYIRPECDIGDNVRIGDYVEIKKSKIGNRTKIAHLTYVGDAVLGENCNLGCGVVVVNYDGKKKSVTVIGDNAFVGCNVNLVAPVEIERDSYIAAGSTITKNVPQKALAVARARQTNIDNWVDKRNMQRK